MCDTTVKGLLAKVWKDEEIDLAPGTHYVDEVFTVHVSGSVQKQNDAMVAPTTSLPLIPIIALLLERSGITREHSINLLRDILTTAINNGQCKSQQLEDRMKDVESAIKTVREQILSRLPKQRRSGRVVTRDVSVHGF